MLAIGNMPKEIPAAIRKASLRAKEPAYRVDLVAAKFNGGGHACAAGLNLKTGAEKWTVAGMPSGCCSSPVAADGVLFFAGWSPVAFFRGAQEAIGRFGASASASSPASSSA